MSTFQLYFAYCFTEKNEWIYGCILYCEYFMCTRLIAIKQSDASLHFQHVQFFITIDDIIT